MESIVYLLIISIIWSLYCNLIYVYNKKFSLKITNYDRLMVVRHNCYSFNARHIYLIKLFYGRARKKFFFLTTILLEFIDQKSISFLTLEIPPKVLFESQREGFKEGDKGKAKLLAFILQTKISLSDAERVRISHGCKAGDLFIYDIRIIDLITKDSYTSFVQNWIRFLTAGTHPRAQVFGITSPGRNMTDIKPSPYLIFPETAVFWILGLHYILFHTQYTISSRENWFFAKTYDSIPTMVLTSVMSALCAVILSSISSFIYYCVIKRPYSELKGIGLIWIIRFSYLFFIVCLSLVLGLIAALKQEDDPSVQTIPSNDSQWDSSTLKWFAIVLGFAVFSLAFFSIAVCLRLCGLCRDGADYELRSEDDKSFKSVKTVSTKEMKSESNKSIKGLAIQSSRDSPRKAKGLALKPVRSQVLSTQSNFKSNP